MKENTTSTPPAFGDEYKIWMIRNAAKYDIKFSEFHPDVIRQRIKELEELLAKALSDEPKA